MPWNKAARARFFEESYGYMMGDYVRDKDAVTASMMATEMAAYYYDRGMTLIDAIDELYKKYGYYSEETVNLFMYGVDGLGEMRALMASLRTNAPAEIGGVPVTRVRDYQTGDVVIPGLGVVEKTPISGSNVLYFELNDGSALVVRPSGTEPKIKLYVLARGGSAEECQAKKTRFADYARSLADKK